MDVVACFKNQTGGYKFRGIHFLFYGAKSNLMYNSAEEAKIQAGNQRYKASNGSFLHFSTFYYNLVRFKKQKDTTYS